MPTAQRQRRTISRRSAKADINVTPLIDILLVLLAIFMVITPVTPTGLDARVPQPAPPNPEPPRNETLVVSLDHNGELTLNEERLEPQALLPRLQEVLKTRSDRTVFVQADNELFYNEIVRVIDTAHSAGADRVGLLTSQIRRAGSL
jgi:biopolymer transport protein ExbD